VADEERSEADKRWTDRLIYPLDGPASENAYPEDMTIGVDGNEVPMNNSARRWNKAMGYTDKAADKPWKGPEEDGSPSEESSSGWTDEQLAEQAALREKLDASRPIEVVDADTDRIDPESQHRKLMASVRKMGIIECSCGWAGEATEASIVGHGSPLELNCPDCRRLIYALLIEE
jgi:hypothetical protein